MFTCDRKKRKLVEEKKLLLVNQRCCSSGCYSGWIVISSRSHVEKGTAVSGANADEQQGNRLAAHTLAVIERCECACGSAANATTLAKLSLPLASLAKLARCIAHTYLSFPLSFWMLKCFLLVKHWNRWKDNNQSAELLVLNNNKLIMKLYLAS
ncbi:hypothetical protein T07_14983 [Trichinella nelsoni]|uniref:Uncharacterized protein n=1 Tax=Trichinella nelsoni TaxID=6336 RepID=A0A0V0S8Q0_9BILA|nr:hypothetical protein T07_14983 [Trichinella nelsoni]